MANKRKGKYVVRPMWAGTRVRMYFTRKDQAMKFCRWWGINAAVRKNV